MEQQIFIEFQQFISAFMPYITGGLLVWVINKAKSYFGLVGNQVLILTIALSLVLGVLSLITENFINPDSLTLANAAETAIAVFTVATAWYFKISRPKLEAKQQE